MGSLRYLTAGESHGRMLLGILEGLPAGLPLRADEINGDLARRQRGYGRGSRMKIEHDVIEIVSGVRKGYTLGGPLGLLIRNRDWENWQEAMAVEPGDPPQAVTRPRPGHADLAGAVKYGQTDVRNVLERASARETAMRVAIGAAAKRLLAEFGIRVVSHVTEIGGIRAAATRLTALELFELAEKSEVRCADAAAGEAMIKKINEAGKQGNTLGGVFEVVVIAPPIGLGSYAQWDRRLDARLAGALMSIQAIKGVEVGLGFEVATRLGSKAHDEIFYERGRFTRKTNHAGGLEGGISNGQEIVLRAAMKPLSSLRTPLRSVDLITKAPFEATVERSDVCSVPAAGVVGEAVVAFEIAVACLEKFGGDGLRETKANFLAYQQYVEQF